MDESGCPPVIVEGDWSPAQTKTIKNKLQIHFGSKKKSNGGDCRVEAEDVAPRAAVYFKSAEVRERVLARGSHEVVVDGRIIKLRLVPASSSTSSDDGAVSRELQPMKPMSSSELLQLNLSRELQPMKPMSSSELLQLNSSGSDLKKPGDEPSNGASEENKEESEGVQNMAVVLDNVSHNMSKDLLSMLVENMMGLDDRDYSLEIIWENNAAVITFRIPSDVERFLAVSQSSPKLQKHRLTARPLEAALSVRVERLPPTATEGVLELYFERKWTVPERIVMIAEEQAAIVLFSDPKVVPKICIKQDHMIRSLAIKVYPYYQSLGTALYGDERPTWKLPEPFTERVEHAVWKFLSVKKLWNSINDQMRPFFCIVDFENSQVKLRPLPCFLRQSGLTEDRVTDWMSTAQKAFCQLMSQYVAFECAVSPPAFKAAEKDLHSVVREDAVLVMDASREIVTVAGRADSISRIRAPVENIVCKAMNQIVRQKEGVSEEMKLAPAEFYILQQEGLRKAANYISSEMKLSYNDTTRKLTIAGLPAEVFRAKAWILEKNAGLRKKRVDVSPGLIDFLEAVDPMDLSEDLFTSQGTSSIYSIENKAVLLLGSSDRVLVDAENKLKTALALHDIDVNDPEVLQLPNWVSLKQNLLDTYNSLKKTTVALQIHPQGRNKISVAGFLNPVQEVSRSVTEFIVNYSQVQETIRVQSCAVVQFIIKKKAQDYTGIADSNNVRIHFNEERPRVFITGARIHVQKAKTLIQGLISSLSTDNLTIDKPGAKKYFQSQGSLFLSTIMMELNCVALVGSDNQEYEEDENENGFCFCKVKTATGVLVSVSKANICSLRVDAVVNAANKDLQHTGGLALALLQAAGPDLKKISDKYIMKNGPLRTGDAIVTDAGNLPCKHIVHTVGPRFYDHDLKTSVSLLSLAVKQSLTEAEKVNCSTVALPAISSGIFGFPVELCADTIVQTVREYCDNPRARGSLNEIHLVDNNDKTVRILVRAVKTEFSDLGPTVTEPQQAGAAGTEASGHQEGQRQLGGKGAGQQGGQNRTAGRGSRGGRRDNSGRQNPKGHNKSEGMGRMEQTTAEGLMIVLQKGNIQDQTTFVIVNTISENMNLKQGAVSGAILQVAGPSLQVAVCSAAGVTMLRSGNVIVTDGFDLKCQKVFHVVCPPWDNGAGQAEDDLISIIRFCLEEAEKFQMSSVSFPAIGTGNLNFPKDLVSRVLLREVHSYSRRKNPCHLKEVVFVVHPNDHKTYEYFTREFSGRPNQRNIQHEADLQSAAGQSLNQSQQSSASSFSQVSSPSLGVYRMQMGQLTLEVSSGDITREVCDVIVNSSNQGFTLKSGVSKAILDSAGATVEQECAQIVNSPGYLPRPMIVTSAGMLLCRSIIHIVGRSDPAEIKNIVYSVLKFCEESGFQSVTFPALGTGQGGASPSVVADAMVEAVVDFVKKKHPASVHTVKILIFQTTMVPNFHQSMMKRQGEQMDKGLIGRIRDAFTSWFGLGEESARTEFLVLEKEEFEPTQFQLCADNDKAVSLTKKRIKELIEAEQARRNITDLYIRELSKADLEELRSLQKQLTVSISLDRGQEDQEPSIQVEGLTRDVFTAEAEVRKIIQKVERRENMKQKASQVSERVAWKYQQHSGQMVSFDSLTNLSLEEAFERRTPVSIKINGETYHADLTQRKAFSAVGHRQVELLREDKKVAVPSNWTDMKGALLCLFPLTPGSQEYSDVEQKTTNTGLAVNIISIERVQNPTLWQTYQLLKKQLEVKNGHTNNERHLFHGTGAASIDLINNCGFNRGYAGTHGAMYGKGTYFAVDPKYSASGYAKPDAQGHKRMYLARVLVGDFTQGKAGIVAPPNKNTGNTSDLYNSVTDNVANPTMFIIFNDIQAYPEYLITFA